MENGTRVSDITRKFENLNSKDCNVKEDLNSKCRLNLVHSHTSSSNGPVFSSKCVIKRSNAFRNEKTTKAQSSDTHLNSNSKVYTKLPSSKDKESKPKNPINPYTRKKPYSVALNERNKLHAELHNISLSSQNYLENLNALPKTQLLTPEPVIAKRSPEVIRIKQQNEFQYTPVKLKSGEQQYSTDTLRKVLSSPLPCGPPPRKPPRTFQYGFPPEDSFSSPPKDPPPPPPTASSSFYPPDSIESKRLVFQRSKTEPTINLSRPLILEIPAGRIQAVTKQLDQRINKNSAKHTAAPSGLCLRTFCGLSPAKVNNPIYDVPFHPSKTSPTIENIARPT